MNAPIQLISTDFDGTLHADSETPPVPHDLQEIIARLQALGTKWVVNTGRDLSSVMEGIARARLTIRPDYLVVVEREIYIHQETQYVQCEAWNEPCRRQHAELFERVRLDVPRLVSWISKRFAATLYEDDYSPFCLIAENNLHADQIQEYLEVYCREVPLLTVVRNDVYARFSHVAYNKGTALGEIARWLGIDKANVLAAGDHYNDVPMLSTEVAACLVAPVNAIEPVKELVRKQGGYVSHQPWGHGVARGLEYYLGQAG